MVRHLVSVLCIKQNFCFFPYREDVVVEVPGLGYIRGRTMETLGNLNKPKKSYYNFRNIPFAQSVSHQYRFSVSLFQFS